MPCQAVTSQTQSSPHPSRLEGSQPTSEAGRWHLTHTHYYDSPCIQPTRFCHLSLKQHLLLSATLSNKPAGSQGTPRMAGAAQGAQGTQTIHGCAHPPIQPHTTPLGHCAVKGREHCPWRCSTWVRILTPLTLTSWVILGKIFHHSGPPFPHLHNGKNTVSYLIK